MAVQSPRFQTLMAERIVNSLRDKIDGEIVFDKLMVRPFDALVLHNIAIIDGHPYVSDTSDHRLDTLFKAESLTATFKLKGLFNHEGLHLGKFQLDNAKLFLVTEPKNDGSGKGRTNLARIFNLHSSGKEKADSEKDLFDASIVRINNFEFAMLNLKKPSDGHPDGSIDWKDMDVTDINIIGKKVKMKGKVMSGVVDKMSFKEKSGYVCNNLSGRAEVGDGLMSVRDMRLQDPYSDLDLREIDFAYKNSKSWSHFMTDVLMDIKLKPSKLNTETIGFFTRALTDKSIALRASGNVHGCVNDLNVSGLNIQTVDSDASLVLDGSLTGIPHFEQMEFQTDISDAYFTTNSLGRILKELLPGTKIGLQNYAKGQNFHFNGRLHGPMNKVCLHGNISCEAGGMYADIDLDNLARSRKPLSVVGTIQTDRLDIGKITGIKAVGECTLRTKFDATMTKGDPQAEIDSLFVDKLDILGYSYTGIAAAGRYEGKAFNGKVICNDPNLNFLFQGLFTLSRKTMNKNYQFYANVGYADLHALNIDKRERSKVSLQTVANFNSIESGDLIGNIDIKNVSLEDVNGRHDIGNIFISSHINDDINRIKMTSKFADAMYIGSDFVDSFAKDLMEITARRELSSLCGQRSGEWSGNNYDLTLTFHDSRDLLSFFKPGLYIADNTKVKLDISNAGGLSGSVTSDRLAFMDKYVKGLDIDISNADDALSGGIGADEIKVSPILAKNCKMLLSAQDDHAGIDFSYDNDSDNKGQFKMDADFARSQDDSLSIKSSIEPSEIRFGGQIWQIGRAGMEITKGNIGIDGFSLSSVGQKISIDGGLSKTKNDSLRMSLRGFDVSLLDRFIVNDLSLEGSASGNISIISPMGSKFGLLANIVVDNLEFGNEKLGQLRLVSTRDDSNEGFRIRCRNVLDSRQMMLLSALYKPSDNSLQAEADFDGFSLGVASPFLDSVFSDIYGKLSGKITASGQLKTLDLSSDALALHDGGLTLDYTNVPYKIDGPLHIDKSGLWFDGISLKDRYDGSGSINGGVTWSHFKNIGLDIHLGVQDIEALNTTESMNSTFYGNVFADGNVDVTGSLSNISINVNAATAKSGKFHIPMDGASGYESSDLLTFKEEEKPIVIDPYEQMMRSLNVQSQKETQLGINLRVNVDQDTEALIEVDKASGNVLKGRGTGLIDLVVKPSQDIFTINGDYKITSGSYHLGVLGIANRDFTLQEGGTVKFNGDVMDSDLDIKATYKTKASIGTLIADTLSTRRNVIAGINISDKLSSPKLGFSIEIPDLDPSTQALVSTALSTEDKVQKQFLSLVISNGFLPDETSGIVNNSSMLYSSVSEIMANQLNNILQKLEIPVDLGLNYSQTTSGSNLFDVAVSTELFNNRVMVNGAIGNRQYSTTTNNDEVVGDLDIEIKIDKRGALRLTLFSHSADQYTSYLDNSQRNGVGITFQKEFDTFGEFFRSLFKRKDKSSPALPSEKRVKIEIEPEDKK